MLSSERIGVELAACGRHDAHADFAVLYRLLHVTRLPKTPSQSPEPLLAGRSLSLDDGTAKQFKIAVGR